MAEVSASELASFLGAVGADGAGMPNLDAEEANKWIERIADVESEETADPELLRSLFQAARFLLEYKAAEADAVGQEVGELGTQAGELGAEVRRLREDLSTARARLGTAGEAGDVGISELVEEKELAEEQRDEAIRNLDELKTELVAERTHNERLLRQVKELDQQNKEKTTESFGLQSRVDELSKVISGQKLGGKHGDETTRKLRERTEQLSKIIDECNKLSGQNDQLKTQVEELSTKLALASDEMETTTTRYAEIKDHLVTADEAISALEADNRRLRAQLEASGQAADPDDAYTDLLSALNDKIESWKGLIVKKEAEVEASAARIRTLETEVAQMSLDSDKASVAALTKGVADRDSQIVALKRELEAGTQEVEETTRLLKTLQSQASDDGNAGGRRVGEAVAVIRRSEAAVKDARHAEAEARHEAERADLEKAQLLARMQAYEKGVFGLPEAVAEAREAGIQVQFRDKQIRALQGRCSEALVTADELAEENGALRSQLGLPERPRPAAVAKAAAQESDRALNIILQKEVEKLEDERIELKLQLRATSRAVGEKADQLGLEADDLLALEELTEELRLRRQGLVSDWDQARAKALKALFPDQQPGLAAPPDSNDRLRHLERQNIQLIQGLKECQAAMTASRSGGSSGLIECPVLEELLKAIGGSGEWKGDDIGAAELRGANSVLRESLDRAASELTAAQLKLLISERKILSLEEAAETVGPDASGNLDLPPHIPQSTASLIFHLNERLIQALDELNRRELEAKTMEVALAAARENLSGIQRSQHMLYQEYQRQKDAWAKESTALAQRMSTMEELEAKSQIQVQEYDHYLETQSRSSDERAVRLAEMSRKYLLLRINEKMMSRKYAFVEETSASLRRENQRLQHQQLALETSVRRSLAQVHQQKELAVVELESLRASTARLVPAEELEAAEAALEALAADHRRLVEKDVRTMSAAQIESDAVVTATRLADPAQRSGLQTQLSSLEAEKAHLERLLTTEKEKSVKFEALGSLGMGGGDPDSSERTDYLTKRVALLEMTELESRQRAERATRLAEKRLEEITLLQADVSRMDATLQATAESNLALQASEEKTRLQLATCTPADVFAAANQRIAALEKARSELAVELDSYRSMSEIAESQADHWRRSERKQAVEMGEVRRAFLDLQAESQHKAIIARLYRELLEMKLAAVDREEDLKVSARRLSGLESRLLRSEIRGDEKERSLWRSRRDAQHKLGAARATISELRVRFGGAVSLAEQGRLQALMAQNQAEKLRLKGQANAAELRREEVEMELGALMIKKQGLDLLLAAATATPAKQMAMMTEWQGKMEALRISDMKLRRGLDTATAKVGAGEEELAQLRGAVEAAEATQAAAERNAERRQLDWEQREMELERRVALYEGADAEEEALLVQIDLIVEDGGSGLDSHSCDLFDELCNPSLWGAEGSESDLSLSDQLHRTQVALRSQVQKTSQLRHENVQLKESNDCLHLEKRKLESSLQTKDVMTAQLGSLMRSSDDGLRQTGALRVGEERGREDFAQVVKGMQTTLDILRKQLRNAEAEVERERKAAAAARADVDERERRHLAELSALRNTDNGEFLEHLGKLRAESDALISGSVLHDERLSEELLRRAEAEDRAAEWEERGRVLLGKLEAARAEAVAAAAGRVAELARVESGSRRSRDHFAGEEEDGERAPTFLAEAEPASKPDTPTSSPPSSRTSSDSTVVVQKPPPKKTGGKGQVPSKPAPESSKKEAQKEPKERPMGQSAVEWKVKSQRLQSQLKDCRTENKNLHEALGEIQTKLLQPGTGKSPDQNTRELQKRVEELEEQLSRVRSSSQRSRHREEDILSEIASFQADLKRKDGTIESLRRERAELRRENEALELRIRNLRESIKFKVVETENRQLGEKVAALERQLRTSRKSAAEKPLESKGPAAVPNLPLSPPHQSPSPQEAVAKWEESKRWQRQTEQVREKLKDKEAELAAAATQTARLSARIQRLEAQNEELLSAPKKGKKMTAGSRQVMVTPIAQSSAARATTAENAQLKTKISELEARLRQGHEKKVKTQSQGSTDGDSEATRTLNELAASARSLLTPAQEKTTRLDDGKAVSLALAMAKKPDESTSELMEQVTTLQNELERALEESELLSAQLDATAQRAGAVETINAQQSRIDVLEAELRAARAGAEATLSEPHLKAILDENLLLKEKLTRAAPRVAWAEGGSAQVTKSKAQAEIARLGQVLAKEEERSRQLYLELRGAREAGESASAEFSNTRTQVLSLESTTYATAFGGSGRMYQEQLMAKEAIIREKTKRLAQLEELLFREAEKGQRLAFENHGLTLKLRGAEWESPLGFSPSDCTSLIRQLKTRVAELESLDVALRRDLEVSERSIRAAITEDNRFDVIQLQERLRNYEAILRENIDLKLQVADI